MSFLVREHRPGLVEGIKRSIWLQCHDSVHAARFRGLSGFTVSRMMDIRFTISPALPNRFLVCVPRGGLNDVLCQVYRCMIYGHLEKFNYEREPADETHVLFRPRPLRLFGLRQFFVVPSKFIRSVFLIYVPIRHSQSILTGYFLDGCSHSLAKHPLNPSSPSST